VLEEIVTSAASGWLLPVWLGVEAAVGLVALHRIRKECRARRVRSPATVAAVWLAFLLHTALIAVVSWAAVWPLPIDAQAALFVGLTVASAGAGFALAGFNEFRSLQRMSGLASDRLVMTGIYRLSRNPQNLGWGLLLLGMALAGRSGLGCLLACVYWVVFRSYVTLEEQHLAWVFAAQWSRYKSETPRFLGLASLLKLVPKRRRIERADARRAAMD
jgi:protein-S-isoprenylcysteine O-methyltransferase Ste14